MRNISVSICLPTYNNGGYIGKTITSILNQTHQNFELIVCDNASTDNTSKVVASFNDPRIRYFRNSENIGSNRNFAKAWELSKYDYIAFYHSDDVYELEIVAKELAKLVATDNIGAVFTLDKLIDENGKALSGGVNLPPELKGLEAFNFDQLYRAMLVKSGSFLICPTFMTKRQVLSQRDLYKELDSFGDWIGGAGDLYMYLKIAQLYEIALIKERLINRRISSTQGSTIYGRTRTSRANHFLVLDSFLNDQALSSPLTKEELELYQYNKFWDDLRIAVNLIQAGLINQAKELLSESFKTKYFKPACRNSKNFTKLLIYLFIRVFTGLGLGKQAIRLMNYLPVAL